MKCCQKQLLPTSQTATFPAKGIKRTVRPSAEKAKAHVKEVHKVLRWTIVPLKTLQVLVGKLRHASVILPAAKGFFTPLNFAMRSNPEMIGLGAALEALAALEDLISFMKMLSMHPTHVNELVADMPHYAGYHDAVAEGAEGVWFSLMDYMRDIEADIITDDNLLGSITNSDLELAAEVLAIGVILESAPKSCMPPWARCVTTHRRSAGSRKWPPKLPHLLRGSCYVV